MTVDLKTPYAPATSKQLWLLHILTQKDTRNLNLTMKEASEQIDKLMSKDKTTPTKIEQPISQSERIVIQGNKPSGQTDMDKIQKDFESNCKPLAIEKLKKENLYNDNVKIDFYEFNCKECLFGQSGICEPSWDYASSVSCAGKIESVSYNCEHFESTINSISEYCHRPSGKQCHRKKIDNQCLECQYRSTKFRFDYSHNRTAWYKIIPTIQERINFHTKCLETRKNPSENYKDIDYSKAIKKREDIIRLLNKLS